MTSTVHEGSASSRTPALAHEAPSVPCPRCSRHVRVEANGEGWVLRGPGEPRRVLAGRCPHPACGEVVCVTASASALGQLQGVDQAFGFTRSELARWLGSFLVPAAVVLALSAFPISVFANAYSTHVIGAGRIVVMAAACVLAVPLAGILWFVYLGARDDLRERRTARDAAAVGTRAGRDSAPDSLRVLPDPHSYRSY